MPINDDKRDGEGENPVELSSEPPFEIGAIKVRPASREIEVDGARQILQPRVMQVLIALARRHSEVVSRDELVTTCWNGLAVSEDSINRCIVHIRRLARQTGSFVIETVARVGYRLTVTASNESPPDRKAALGLPQKPSIAVLPFQNMSEDDGHAYFVDGFVEEIITALSRMRVLHVIARNSTFVYKNRAESVKQVGIELNVGYVLEGSVQRAGNRVRIHAQLIETATEGHLWADRFEGDLEDIFDLQDRVASSVVGAIHPSILSVEIKQSMRKRPDSLDAYDCVLRALPGVWALDKQANADALAHLQRAMDLEPGYALAAALAAWCEARRAVYNWTDDLEAAKSEGMRLARFAGDLTSDDPTVLTMLCAAHTVAGDFRLARMLVEKALAFDPNSAWAWNRSGWLRVYGEETDLAIEDFRRALSLSPFDPMKANALAGIGAAHFVAKRYVESATWTEKALLENPGMTWVYRQLVPAWVLLGRMTEAREGVRTLLQQFPDLTVSEAVSAMVFSQETLDRIADGLKTAGLPD